ncbi:MAG: ribonuclease R, partial [Bacteroidales bacterium]|nr:ribonuclease R [Bacteroidales bacterium]
MVKKQKRNRKQKNAISEQVLHVFAGEPFSAFNYKQVSAALGLRDKVSRELIKQIIYDLEADGALIQEHRGKFKLNPQYIGSHAKKRMLEGIVDMKQTGKAYIESKECDEDIFIAANNTNHALDKDRVKVFLFPQRKGRKAEGQIIEVLERGNKQFVGTLEVSSRYAFLVPDNLSVTVDLFIPLNELNGAKNGEKAIAVITDWPEHSKNPFGKITKVLGKPGNNEVEMNSILASYDFPLSFPKRVIGEAKKINLEISSKEIKGRKDFRKTTTFTIDPKDAKDFDDALSIRQLKNGNWEIGIHIADVSHYVIPNTSIDEEAYKRATSIYLVDRVIPMLPEKLSNEVCSLRPNEDKLTFSAVFEIDNNAQVKNSWFGKTVINSNKRFTYEEAQKIIENKKGNFKTEILKLDELAKILRERRFANGAIAFHSTEVKFELDQKGHPIRAYVKEQKDAHKLVEEFMLLANKEVAQFIGKPKGKEKPKTFIYRVHDEPNPEKLATMAEFVDKLGYKMNTGSKKGISNSFNRLFKQIAGKGEQNLIESIAVRTMSKAEYSTQNIGHYGLSFDYYSHFTSPIRRYPDLMVHRLLFHYLSGGNSVPSADYEEKSEHCSELERRAMEAERESVKLKQTEYLVDKVGEEFEGTITGVSKWGIFVELTESHCEGMVSLKTMKDDFYYLDEDNYRVIGHKYHEVYQLGDKVN